MIIETMHDLFLSHGHIIAISFTVIAVWLFCNIHKDL